MATQHLFWRKMLQFILHTHWKSEKFNKTFSQFYRAVLLPYRNQTTQQKQIMNRNVYFIVTSFVRPIILQHFQFVNNGLELFCSTAAWRSWKVSLLFFHFWWRENDCVFFDSNRNESDIRSISTLNSFFRHTFRFCWFFMFISIDAKICLDRSACFCSDISQGYSKISHLSIFTFCRLHCD